MSDERHDHGEGDACCNACGFAKELELAHRDASAESVPATMTAAFALDERGAPRGVSVLVRRGREPAPSQVVAVTSAHVTVRRGSSADVVVNDGALSRKQFTFTFDGDGVVIRDEGSACGTYVNGEKISRAGRRLCRGDKILVGNSVIEVAES
jgi:pSer/pThr/pTyr-binding forkhead associated (FHA) protein